MDHGYWSVGWRKLVAVTAQAEWARRPKLESAGRKKCKCVLVKLIELGLCLEIAMDTLEYFLSPVESPLWAPTLSSLHITLRDSSEVEVDENKKFFFLFC